MSLRHGLAAVALGWLAFAPRSAGAQVLDWSRIGKTVMPSDDDDQPLADKPKSARPRGKLTRRPGLFDASNTTVGYEAEGGPIWYRTRGQGFRKGTLELSLGQTTSADAQRFYLTGTLRTVFRALDSVTYLWTIAQTNFAAGVKTGPLEIESQFGLGWLGISAARDAFSLDILSPRVGVGVAAHFGRFRLAVGAHTEYLWRLFGMGYTARGLTISFRFDTAPAPPF